ncbi:restriction endonuclease subunit S [uncultured Alcanivorax sp.]|jgi:type I restriction enzyme S subunit|uniref:restriction endonuclease subunit S n=1 Tax=uncultured Alcanivorax sp. TaxID=191215 RepID=UPI00258F1B8F|nr:restriction endonuclease subunit S [uncultured Alcanivorax sp.]
MEQVLYSLPDGWEWQTFNDVCTNITDGAHASPKTVDEGFPYVTVRDVNHKGQIDLINCKRISEDDFLSLKKGNCLPPVDSVLLSKDGTVGKVAHVTNDYDEFVVLSSLAIIAPEKTSLSPEYLKYFLLSPEFQDHAIGSKTGAAIKRIVLRTIKNFNIPIAPLEQQKRIVEQLDALLIRMDTAIEHLQESVTLADALYASELASVFSSGQDKWPLRELNEVAEVARGKSKHRPRNDKSLFGGEYPFIQTGDVRGSQKHITNFSATYNEKGLQQSKLWPKDTICLTIAANIGDVAILGMDACFPDSVVGISSSELETDYLYYFLTTLQQQLDSKANAAAQKNINLKILSEIKIPVPTLDEQKIIVKQINEIDQLAVKVKAEISEKITMMQQLKASILDSAFKGEL